MQPRASDTLSDERAKFSDGMATRAWPWTGIWRAGQAFLVRWAPPACRTYYYVTGSTGGGAHPMAFDLLVHQNPIMSQPIYADDEDPFQGGKTSERSPRTLWDKLSMMGESTATSPPPRGGAADGV